MSEKRKKELILSAIMILIFLLFFAIEQWNENKKAQESRPEQQAETIKPTEEETEIAHAATATVTLSADPTESEAPTKTAIPTEIKAPTEMPTPTEAVAPTDVPKATEVPTATEAVAATETPTPTPAGLDINGCYSSKKDVALYLYTYHQLPSNYITKKEAEKLGWSGGSLEPYAPGKCIGGDRFGNYEGVLPDGDYRECDIDTLGKKRGSKRIVYDLTDWDIYYTADHYESFTQLY